MCWMYLWGDGVAYLQRQWNLLMYVILELKDLLVLLKSKYLAF